MFESLVIASHQTLVPLRRLAEAGTVVPMSAGEPETSAGLPAGWRTLITVLIGGGLLLAVLGFWQVLAAEGGTDPTAARTRTRRSLWTTPDGLFMFKKNAV
jgi:hypothetical protein